MEFGDVDRGLLILGDPGEAGLVGHVTGDDQKQPAETGFSWRPVWCGSRSGWPCPGRRFPTPSGRAGVGAGDRGQVHGTHVGQGLGRGGELHLARRVGLARCGGRRSEGRGTGANAASVGTTAPASTSVNSVLRMNGSPFRFASQRRGESPGSLAGPRHQRRSVPRRSRRRRACPIWRQFPVPGGSGQTGVRADSPGATSTARPKKAYRRSRTLTPQHPQRFTRQPGHHGARVHGTGDR